MKISRYISIKTLHYLRAENFVNLLPQSVEPNAPDTFQHNLLHLAASEMNLPIVVMWMPYTRTH